MNHPDLYSSLWMGHCRGSWASEAVSDKQISLLFSTGLLTRQVGKQNSYLFAVAGAGRLVISITRGRKARSGPAAMIVSQVEQVCTVQKLRLQ